MPLKSGKSQATVSANIREIHKGKTYEKTKAKHGKATADNQAVAIALDKQRESMRAIPLRPHEKQIARRVITDGGVVTIRRRNL